MKTKLQPFQSQILMEHPDKVGRGGINQFRIILFAIVFQRGEPFKGCRPVFS
jgi:hypothetical protein